MSDVSDEEIENFVSGFFPAGNAPDGHFCLKCGASYDDYRFGSSEYLYCPSCREERRPSCVRCGAKHDGEPYGYCDDCNEERRQEFLSTHHYHHTYDMGGERETDDGYWEEN